MAPATTEPGASAAGALARITAAIPGGEERAGQLEMAAAVAEAIDAGRHLLVQAGTGTGKTLAYLVAAVLSVAPPWWPPPPRRCRSSWWAATCRSSPPTSTSRSASPC
jgi:hypothetical protein